MPSRSLTSLMVLLALAGAAPGQSRVPTGDPGLYAGDRVVRVAPKTAGQLERVLGLSRHVWSERVGRGPIEVQVSAQALATLRAEGYEVEILVDDVNALAQQDREAIRARRQARLNTAGRGQDAIDFTNYFPLVDILAFVNQLAAERPDMVTVRSIGTSIQGRDIWTMTITAPGDATGRPQVALNSLIHAREWITPPATLMLASRLVREYGSDPRITNLLDQTQFVITPILNPDGYEFAWNVDRFWRKNRRDNGNGTVGVDLNRNFATNFGGNGSSGTSTSETFRGPFAFSEPESAAMRTMLSALPDLRAHVDTHSFSQLVLWSPGVIGQIVPNEAELAALGTDLAQTILDSGGAFYAPQRGIDLYEAGGTFADWTTDALGVMGYTFELRPATGGTGGFAPPPSLILPTATEINAAYLHLAEATATPLRFVLPRLSSVQVDQPFSYTFSVLPGTASPSGPVRVVVRDPRTGTLTTTTAAPLGDDRYTVELTGSDCEAGIDLFIQAGTDAGQPIAFPASAPLGPLVNIDVSDLSSSVVFTDSFATDTGWTVSNGPALTDGGWQRGVPIGGGDRGDPAQDFDGDGFAYLTDNVDGNSDVDGGPAILTSPRLDASEGDARLTFAAWITDSVNTDVMTIELSADDGQTWITADTIPALTGWRERTIDIAPLLGRPANLRFRALVTDAGDPTIVEAGLDAVRLVVDRPCQDVCPADVNGDGAVSPTDFSAWVAAFNTQAPACDQNGDGLCSATDFSAWVANFNAGCP